MTCPQYFHNIFKTNPKWQVDTRYYCWGKKIREMLRLQHFYNKSQVVSCYWFKFETHTKITFLP